MLIIYLQQGIGQMCAQGYTMVKGECTICPVGTYKDTYGNNVCKRCPTGTTAAPAGSTSATSCELTAN